MSCPNSRWKTSKTQRLSNSKTTLIIKVSGKTWIRLREKAESLFKMVLFMRAPGKKTNQMDKGEPSLLLVTFVRASGKT